MTESAIRTQHQHPGTRFNFAHSVEAPDYEHRAVSRQLWGFVPVGFIDERCHQSLGEFVRTKAPILELVRIGGGG